MQQIEIFNFPNPCIGVCEANPKGYCKGCWRSRFERQCWQNFSEMDKKQVLLECQQRKLRQVNEILAARRLVKTKKLLRQAKQQGELF